MKTLCLLLLGLISIMSVRAQELDTLNYFDFWVGHWDLTWDEGDGQKGKGTNHIEATLNGRVIQENFKAIEGQSKGYLGTSISVYHPQSKEWKQTWADNQGSYLLFHGFKEGDKRFFQSEPTMRNGKKLVTRMTFYDIEQDQFKWDWESSVDGGETWKLQWRIFYTRMASTFSDDEHTK